MDKKKAEHLVNITLRASKEGFVTHEFAFDTIMTIYEAMSKTTWITFLIGLIGGYIFAQIT